LQVANPIPGFEVVVLLTSERPLAKHPTCKEIDSGREQHLGWLTFDETGEEEVDIC
jgi:hypothetical protein